MSDERTHKERHPGRKDKEDSRKWREHRESRGHREQANRHQEHKHENRRRYGEKNQKNSSWRDAERADRREKSGYTNNFEYNDRRGRHSGRSGERERQDSYDRRRGNRQEHYRDREHSRSSDRRQDQRFDRRSPKHFDRDYDRHASRSDRMNRPDRPGRNKAERTDKYVDRYPDRRSDRHFDRYPDQHPKRNRPDSGNKKFARHWDKPHYGEYRSENPDEPIIPAGISAADLDAEAQKSLLTLSGANQEIVARHLVMAGEVLESDPELAYQHAQAAVKRAGRVDAVREAAALTAYASGRYEEALREVRATRRMRGGENLKAIEADCERGLGRPQKALQIVEETDTSQLSLAEQAELVLVGAGARADLGQHELALLIVDEALNKILAEADEQNLESTARLLSYKADLLSELGREEEAQEARAAIPEPDDPMEIIDLGAVRDADVDRVRSELLGVGEALVQIYDGLLLDLDGVCYQGNQAVPNAAAAIKDARDAGVSIAFVTNNASRSAAQVVEKLQSLEFEAEESEIMTSAMDVMDLVTEKVEPGAKILVVGSQSLKDLVAEAGYQVVSENVPDIAAVIQGFDPAVSWRELSEAAFALQAGARYYATNMDKTLPIEAGKALGNGALAGAITIATGRRPEAAGKPHASIYLKAIERSRAEKPLAVGDRLDTDIVGASKAQIPALHVLTGVHQAKDVARAEPGARPAFVALDVSGVLESHPAPRHHKDGTWTAGVSQIVFVNQRGHAVIDDIELDPKGSPVTISLDTYRALLAASWEFADQNPNRAVRLPVIEVVSNEDPAGQVTVSNSLPEVLPEATESTASPDSLDSTESTGEESESEESGDKIEPVPANNHESEQLAHGDGCEEK